MSKLISLTSKKKKNRDRKEDENTIVKKDMNKYVKEVSM